jgi:hypothetical protein
MPLPSVTCQRTFLRRRHESLEQYLNYLVERLHRVEPGRWRPFSRGCLGKNLGATGKQTSDRRSAGAEKARKIAADRRGPAVQEMRNKEFDSVKPGAYKPAPPTRDWDQHPAGSARVGSIFDIVDREKGCVGGGPGTRCTGPARKRIQRTRVAAKAAANVTRLCSGS